MKIFKNSLEKREHYGKSEEKKSSDNRVHVETWEIAMEQIELLKLAQMISLVPPNDRHSEISGLRVKK